MNQTRIKRHIRENQVAYIAVGAIITYAIMKRHYSLRPIKGANYGVLAQGANYGVLGQKVEMNNVSYILSNRPGPPSWVVRCLETGEVFKSQKNAALALSIPASRISEQLNGVRNNASGYHFERLCMAI